MEGISHHQDRRLRRDAQMGAGVWAGSSELNLFLQGAFEIPLGSRLVSGELEIEKRGKAFHRAPSEPELQRPG